MTNYLTRTVISIQNGIKGNEMTKKGHRLTLTVEEAGKRVGLGRSASYGAVRRGELPVIRIGRKLLVPEKALELWLAEARPIGR